MAVSKSLPALTNHQILFMLQIDGHSGQSSLSEIREKLNQNPYRNDVTPQAFYNIWKRLEAKGWVEKRTQGRESTVALTATGQRKLNDALSFCRYVSA